MPRRTDLQLDPAHRGGPDRHRPGLRVRLLRHPGRQGPPPGGVRRRPRELEPGDDRGRIRSSPPWTYIGKPLEWRTVTPAIIERERPEAILPTLGGQTGLNLAMKLREEGVLERLGVEMLGARPDSIAKAEDRQLFKKAMKKIGLTCPRAGIACTRSRRPGRSSRDTGFPAILRPSFTLGGSGGGIAYSEDELEAKGRARRSHSRPPTRCSSRGERPRVEGSTSSRSSATAPGQLHRRLQLRSRRTSTRWASTTGDSITVAPAMTLTDREYQRLRDAARAVMTEIGVETGGANVQFSVDPKTDKIARHRDEPAARVAIVSRSPSKATWIPHREDPPQEARRRVHARRAAERHHAHVPAAFEPVIELRRRQVAALLREVPRSGHDARHADEERRRGDEHRPDVLRGAPEGGALPRNGQGRLRVAPRPRGLQSAGRAEAPPRPRDGGVAGARDAARAMPPPTAEETRQALEKLVRATPTTDRLFYVGDAMRTGFTDEELYRLTAIDPWFLAHLRRLVTAEEGMKRGELGPDQLRGYKRLGFSDRQIAALGGGATEDGVRAKRLAQGTRAVYARVDTCAAEFVAYTPYLYSTYETESEGGAVIRHRRKVVILGRARTRIEARASSSTTAACTPSWPLRRGRVQSPSRSTATRRPCRRTTTRPTGCTSSR